MREVRLPVHISPEEYGDRLTGFYPEIVPEEIYEAQQYVFEAFEFLRKTIGEPIVITSGYRTPAHQLRLVLEGVSRTLLSAHIFGVALDIKPFRYSKYTVEDFYRILVEGGYADLRIGYKAYKGKFVHIDAAWMIKEQAGEENGVFPTGWHKGARW